MSKYKIIKLEWGYSGEHRAWRAVVERDGFQAYSVGGCYRIALWKAKSAWRQKNRIRKQEARAEKLIMKSLEE